MQSGRQTLAGIEEVLRDLKAQEAEVQRELESANARRTTLVAERLEALRRLARLKATDASADGVIDEADNLSQQVRAMLEARLKSVAQLKERQKEAEQSRTAHVAEQDRLTERIARLEERLDEFGAAAREALKGDPGHEALLKEHRALALTLEQASAKADQVARDEHEKGLPYRNDPLFMYLWQRNMGTSAYRGSGLVQLLDQWVAGLVRYHEARANYAMLTEIPVRLRSHAEDLRKQTQAARSRLDAREAEKTRELAGSDLGAELTRERARQVELGKELEAITSELLETGNQLRFYAKGEDKSFVAAVAAYASLLEREPLRRLVSEAMATATQEDDRVVEDVRRLAQELDELEAQNIKRRRRLDEIAERKLELTRLASNFRRQRYDDVGSEFDNNPRMEDLLQLLLRGVITAAEYWVRMQQQQHWRHRPGDPWRRQSGLPPFGGFPGGWGGGGSDSSGGGGSSPRSGRDFETGGTF